MTESVRDQVRRSVAERVPIDDVERSMIAEFLTRFDALAHPFDEQADPVHVTGSAIVTGPKGVILLEHRRLGIWLQPGGHVEAGETPWEAALREAREETGIDVRFAPEACDDLGVPRLAHVDVHPGGRGHTHLDLRYLVDGGDVEPDPPAGESQEIGWFGWLEAVERASDHRLQSLLRALTPIS